MKLEGTIEEFRELFTTHRYEMKIEAPAPADLHDQVVEVSSDQPIHSRKRGPYNKHLSRKNKKWKKSEEKFIRDNPLMKPRELSRKLGRTVKSVSLHKWHMKEEGRL